MAKPKNKQLDLFEDAEYERFHSQAEVAARSKPSDEREQLDLFGKSEQAPHRIRAVTPSGELVSLGHRLPPEIRLGTSSWSFPGWAGHVYAKSYPVGDLSQDGLWAYAQHPVFRVVGVDWTYYKPIEADRFAEYAAAVPEDFRFLVKAHEACTLGRYPHHARYGTRANQANPLFLDAAYAAEVVVQPFVRGLGDRAGPLLFQFSPQPEEVLGGVDAFAARLHGFLSALPKGPLYAVEIRNPKLLTPAYAEALLDLGACHCLNAISYMPSIRWQARQIPLEKTPALVIRWMLGRHRQYQQTGQLYQPYDKLIDEDPTALEEIAVLALQGAGRGQPVFITINNHAEGCAPVSVVRLATRIVELRED